MRIKELKNGVMNVMAQVEKIDNIRNGEKYKGFITEDMSAVEMVSCITQIELERKEARLDKQDKTIKLLIGIICTIILIIVGSIAWLFSNFEFVTYAQDGNGINNIVNNATQGDIFNGTEADSIQTQEE